MLKYAVIKTTFDPSYVRDEQKLAVLDARHIPLPQGFTGPTLAHIIQFGAHSWGGNHRHKRQEVFVAFGGDPYIIWRDETGTRHESAMTTTDGKLHAFTVLSMTPHLIENRSATPAFLYELRDIEDGPAESLEGGESLR